MERGHFRLITLRSGARAVQNLQHGEVMHPSMGPWAEAQRLYVEGTGLLERLRARPEVAAAPLVVWDVGLGAGTNAAAVLTAAQGVPASERRTLELHSFENDLDALALALLDAEGFAYLQPLRPAVRALLDHGLYEGAGLTWRLWNADFRQLVEPSTPPSALRPADLVLFDPFSPKANPSLWTRETFLHLRAHAAPECLLATYSASTRTRVSMLLGGWFVGTGPSTGEKSETTVAAVARARLDRPLGARWLERWRRSSARAPYGEDFGPEVEQAVEQHPQFQDAG